MRRVREITAEDENFRLEPAGGNIARVQRDPIEPEPVGTYVACVFRITGYDQDCDGSLMARMEGVDEEGGTIGWRVDHIGLYPSTDIVVESPAELFALADAKVAHDR